MKELSTEFRVRLQQEITMREEAETQIIKQVMGLPGREGTLGCLYNSPQSFIMKFTYLLTQQLFTLF